MKTANAFGRRGAAPKWEMRRDGLIDIAAEVFAERGYDATSIDDLVKATKLQRGGLYYYIGGKKALLLDIHRRVLEPLLEDTRAIAASGVPPDEALRQIARLLVHTIQSSRAYVTVFLNEWRIIETDPEWKEVRAGRIDYERQVESVLARGRDDGIFDADDLPLLAMAFLGMINYTYRWFNPRGRADADAVADRLSGIFLGGIMRRPAKR